ncbi:MaoC family dehydratase [Halomonas cerina]|uniref:Acyl dehydratase n=1 Tax=Halomonas cerina TaxID=447424 RepID=A0A839VDC6_9GAMM|nr:MaoC/PaaZ C-terminal domain-containing protein [Halomonas cerina]MBB3191960.1 acyl dehydratase [Halomonas cerina]
MSTPHREDRLSDLGPTWLREMQREVLHAYAELSGDHNPIHLDREAAVQAGHPDLICHGMLAMTDIGGWLTRAMAGWQLEMFSCRFVAPMGVGTRLKVVGYRGAPHQAESVVRVGVDIVARDAEGVVRVTGRADFHRPNPVHPVRGARDYHTAGKE